MVTLFLPAKTASVTVCKPSQFYATLTPDRLTHLFLSFWCRQFCRTVFWNSRSVPDSVKVLQYVRMPGVVLIQSLYVVQIDLCQSHQDYGSRARAHTRRLPYNITGRCTGLRSTPAPGVPAIPG